MSARLTADHAKRILSEQLGSTNADEIDAELRAIQSGPDEHVELLPITGERVSEAPLPRESRPSKPRESRPESGPPPEPVRLARSELAVYALASVVITICIVAMALLMKH